jgi:hypothetical protein
VISKAPTENLSTSHHALIVGLVVLMWGMVALLAYGVWHALRNRAITMADEFDGGVIIIQRLKHPITYWAFVIAFLCAGVICFGMTLLLTYGLISGRA